MKRIDGFIDVDSMLQEIGIDTITLNSILESPLINIIKDNTNGIHFSFEYGGETYFYKYSSYVKNGSKITISPYNELVAEELSKDFGIPCISYDLATIGFNKGVLSKNYKKENTNYIEGKIILSQFSNYPENILENKTGCPMPEERKNFYLSNYQEHKRRLEKVLGLTVEREEHNERKNR